jgi:RNA polymerase sigma-70 factor (ECF subfamily)
MHQDTAGTTEGVGLTDREFSQRITALTQTLYRVCVAQLPNKSDREEAVQECIAKAWQHRNSLKNARYLQTWMVRILINTCHDIQRRNGREIATEQGTVEVLLETEHAEKGGPLPELDVALLRLNEDVRMPLILHYVEGFRIREIAGILGIPQGTVKTRLMRGRQVLRELLADGDDHANLPDATTEAHGPLRGPTAEKGACNG